MGLLGWNWHLDVIGKLRMAKMGSSVGGLLLVLALSFILFLFSLEWKCDVSVL